MTDDIATFNAGTIQKPRIPTDPVQRVLYDARLRREDDIQRRLFEIRSAAVHAFKAQR